ncbi:MAG: YccF domain-containing protein [Spirochaetales bacterium]|jgi:uncharacterized membrane protein YccF (DUF307 family)|nr:YccF domain-containing protein [Spirochaetales bacterium]
MRLIGNLIWIIFGGLLGAIGWLISALLLIVTVIGIPFGLQCVKIALLTLWPFGHEAVIGEFGAVSLTANIIWILLFGWELFIYHAFLALIFSITLLGIPFGKQHLKLAMLALVPFGSRVL